MVVNTKRRHHLAVPAREHRVQHVLHHSVIITNNIWMNVPHVLDEARVSVDNLGGQWDGICLAGLH